MTEILIAIRARMRKRGMSAYVLMQMVEDKLSMSTVYNLMKGQVPTVTTLLIVLDALDLKIDIKPKGK